jgi:methylenetetrahydrofolate dehydrogenase (NADP+)/methenyltetrahydrofolate cyclohydrolase
MILDGRRIKNIVLDEVKYIVKDLSVKPKLVVIQIGNDFASDVYVKQKRLMCEYVGYLFECIKLDNNVDTAYVIDIISELNNDNMVTGIIVQLPISKNLDVHKIINSIDYRKDVDGLTDINCGKLFHNSDCLCSCTSLGIMELFKQYDISLLGKNVVILGRSDLVGKPIGMIMINEGATVTICNSNTSDLSWYTKNADILISAIGKAKFITGDMIKDDSVIIDVGINYIDGNICGDVDYESVSNKVSYITPVPGGVGPMTISMLAKNILKAYNNR